VNAKDAVGGDRITQFGRALMDLNIDIICANSPQAKGRIERAFATLQDRMVKELRLVGVSTIAAANAWLRGLLQCPLWPAAGERQEPASAVDPRR
jgi:phosphate uptake regulator